MVTIDDFEKRYVASVNFHESDEILITEENIEPLRQALKKTNFHWVSGPQIADCELINSGMISNLNRLNQHVSCYVSLKMKTIWSISTLSTMSLLTTKGDKYGKHSRFRKTICVNSHFQRR